MLFAGMKALAGAAVVDHARNACQTKGSGPGLNHLRTRPRSWGKGGVRALPPTPLKFRLAHHPGLAVPQASSLGCPLLVSVLLWRWRCGWC